MAEDSSWGFSTNSSTLLPSRCHSAAHLTCDNSFVKPARLKSLLTLIFYPQVLNLGPARAPCQHWPAFLPGLPPGGDMQDSSCLTAPDMVPAPAGPCSNHRHTEAGHPGAWPGMVLQGSERPRPPPRASEVLATGRAVCFGGMLGGKAAGKRSFHRSFINYT